MSCIYSKLSHSRYSTTVLLIRTICKYTTDSLHLIHQLQFCYKVTKPKPRAEKIPYNPILSIPCCRFCWSPLILTSSCITSFETGIREKDLHSLSFRGHHLGIYLINHLSMSSVLCSCVE